MKKKRIDWGQKLGDLSAFVDGLDADPNELTRDEKIAILEARGVDIKGTMQAVLDMVAGLRGQERLDTARKARNDMLERLQTTAPANADPSLLQRIRDALQLLAGQQPQLAGVYFRRFEQATERDLQSLLDDLQLLQKIHDADR